MSIFVKNGMKIFIAIPTYGRTLKEIMEDRTIAQERLTKLPELQGTEFFVQRQYIPDGSKRKNRYIQATKNKIKEADAVYFSGDWENDEICMEQYEYAVSMDKEIIK